MTLTEQWKKGELKQGEYWCKIIESPYIERVYLPCCDDIIVEVLAPVPSYEEWQELKEASDGLSKLMFKSLMNRFVKADEERERLSEENQQLHKFLEEFNALDVAKENKQLKKLLLVCREMLAEYRFSEGDFTIGDIDTSLLLNMIDNAIGEKK